MRSILVIINLSILLFSVIVMVSCESKEVSIESEEVSIKKSFVHIIEEELESLKAWGADERANPEKTIRYLDSTKTWYAFYKEYSNYTYDIQKTNSIVSPYIGTVTFHGKRFVKKGDTKLDCLNSEWTNPGESIPTLKYAYQDGKWALKEAPPVYRKH